MLGHIVVLLLCAALSAAPSGNETDPVVRVTVRISSTVAEIGTVEAQISAAFQGAPGNPRSFLENFNARGHNLTSAVLESMTSSLVRPAAAPSRSRTASTSTRLSRNHAASK